MRTRLILAAYPKGARRAEIEDLLLMAAADGHAEPGARGVTNLLRHGLRARLGRAGSNGVVALAMIVSVIAGFLLASATSRLAWEAAPDLPDGARRAALGEVLAPGRPVQWSQDSSGDPFPVVDGQVRPRRLSGVVADTAETGDGSGYLTGVAQRLQAQGWRVSDTSLTGPTAGKTGAGPNDAQVLLARNAHLVLWIEDVRDLTERQGRLNIHVHRAEPPWISVLTFVAGLFGALLGWLLFGWGSRRTEHHRAATTAAGFAVVLAMVLLAPALSLGLIFLNVFTGDYLSKVPFWAALVPTSTFGGLAVAAGVAAGTALVIAALRRPGRSRQRPASA
ncbi:hypothetical protein [Actinoplanes sp. NPDC049316]|uniref:hypothetical protein n=1 Tax=Actinoplanes sp. NPDC049316 TaxID=3154727 RepID=UPI003432D6AC